MMNFRVVNKAITCLLGKSAAGRFRVVGFQGQGQDASEIRNNKRLAQSYFSSGQFPKSSGRFTGATQHEMTFTIGLSVTSSAKANLNAINNVNATPSQIASALGQLQEGAAEADILMDELFEMVYQILMDGRNVDLGLPVGTISSRWINQLQKDEPQPQGDLVVLTGSVQYTCQTVEAVTGLTGVLMTGGISTQIDQHGDDVEKAGVDVVN